MKRTYYVACVPQPWEGFMNGSGLEREVTVTPPPGCSGYLMVFDSVEELTWFCGEQMPWTELTVEGELYWEPTRWHPGATPPEEVRATEPVNGMTPESYAAYQRWAEKRFGPSR